METAIQKEGRVEVLLAGLLGRESRHNILELGSGQGRDTLFFLQSGFEVCALDYSEKGLQDLRKKAEQTALGHAIRTVCHDARKPFPFAANTFAACYSHMFFCMAMTTRQLERLAREVRRVLKPGRVSFYTVRNTDDPHYATGIHRGENQYEIEVGFIMHFFDRRLVNRLAVGYKLSSVEAFEEGGLPKRLWLVTQRKEN